MICLIAGFVGCGLWLPTPQSCRGEARALLQHPRNAAALRGNSSAELDEPVQTLEGVLTLPDFSPYRIFITHSQQNKEITGKGEFSAGLLPLPSVPGTRILLILWSLFSFLLDHDGEEMWIFSWFWWLWCSFSLNISPGHDARSGRFVVFNEDEPHQREEGKPGCFVMQI